MRLGAVPVVVVKMPHPGTSSYGICALVTPVGTQHVGAWGHGHAREGEAVVDGAEGKVAIGAYGCGGVAGAIDRDCERQGDNGGAVIAVVAGVGHSRHNRPGPRCKCVVWCASRSRRGSRR